MLKQQIEQEIKDALRAGDQAVLSTLRFLLADIRNKEIEKQAEVTDEDVLAIIQKQVKQHKESIDFYTKGGREDLVSKEQAEVDILNKYLPQQLSAEEVEKIARLVIKNLPLADQTNFGKVMGATMAQVKGQTDGAIVSAAVKKLLS